VAHAVGSHKPDVQCSLGRQLASVVQSVDRKQKLADWHVVPGAHAPAVSGGMQKGNVKHRSPTQVHDVGQSELVRQPTSAMHDAVPRLQTVPIAQSPLPRHGVDEHAPAMQRAPAGQSESRPQLLGAVHDASKQNEPGPQSTSRPHAPTNTQP
jgi:hypothetical protein